MYVVYGKQVGKTVFPECLVFKFLTLDNTLLPSGGDEHTMHKAKANMVDKVIFVHILFARNVHWNAWFHKVNSGGGVYNSHNVTTLTLPY